ncbi:phage antirepressor KilAC domain-containing protein [Rhodococcus sp. NPDC055112]
MSDLTIPNEPEGGESPFDEIKRAGPDGAECWSAREYMASLGYGADWRNFVAVIEKAKIAASNQGYDVADHFVGVTENSGQQGGRPREDCHLSRFACYLVAMNGDPRKPEVAAAQAYFAIRTREAEIRPALDLSTPAGVLAMAEQFTATARQLVVATEAQRQLEAKVEHDAPKVAKAEAHSGSTTSIHRQDFAREVQTWGKKVHGIWILQANVMAFLTHKGMTIHGERSDAGQATATAIRNGWAENVKRTDEKSGRTSFTTYLHPRGQDIAWKWITKYVDKNGSLQLPREINGGDAA